MSRPSRTILSKLGPAGGVSPDEWSAVGKTAGAVLLLAFGVTATVWYGDDLGYGDPHVVAPALAMGGGVLGLGLSAARNMRNVSVAARPVPARAAYKPGPNVMAQLNQVLGGTLASPAGSPAGPQTN